MCTYFYICYHFVFNLPMLVGGYKKNDNPNAKTFANAGERKY